MIKGKFFTNSFSPIQCSRNRKLPTWAAPEGLFTVHNSFLTVTRTPNETEPPSLLLGFSVFFLPLSCLSIRQQAQLVQNWFSCPSVWPRFDCLMEVWTAQIKWNLIFWKKLHHFYMWFLITYIFDFFLSLNRHVACTWIRCNFSVIL